MRIWLVFAQTVTYGTIISFTFKLYNIHNYSLSIFLLTKLFTTNGHKTFSTDALSVAKQSHNRNDYYWIHHRNVGKHYRNIKITSRHQNRHLLLYKPAEQFPSGLGRFLVCRKWYILVITWALGICLIYMPVPSGLGIYI